VVGTTGFTHDDIATFAKSFTGSNCVIAANFAIGAVLMMKFAEQAAPYFETAEIIEFHHNSKADVPSGTALATAERMAAASADWAADPTKHEIVPGARGGVGPAGIRVHGVRMHGMTASQEVILGTAGQTLTIRHDSHDRISFMPGVILACQKIASLPDRITIGIDSLL
jgi:4-hydroxy-tetrahydrodipicolinate reductase